jgi:tripartite ATP-independent transporter DctP family solute receptor
MKIIGKKSFIFLCVCFIVCTNFNFGYAADKIQLKLNSPFAEDDPIGVASLHFQKRIGELTNDKVEVKIFPRGVLGGEMATLESFLAGNIDINWVSNTVLTNVVPTLSALDLPYGFSNTAHCWKVIDGPIGQYLNSQARDKGIRVLGWAYAGSRCMIFKNKAINSVSDLSGLKVRVPENPLYSETIKSWGANPTTIPWTEVYLALSQGVADGIETAPGPSFDKKHYEVAKYLIKTNHLIYFHLITASEKTFKNLPVDIQMAITVAGNEAALIARERRIKQELGVYDEFAKNGVTVIDPDRKGFIEKSRVIYDKFKEKATPMTVKLFKLYE